MSNFQELQQWTPIIHFDTLEATLKSVASEYRQKSILPEPTSVFNAFLSCSPEKLSVVLVGQDPYPQKGVATGLAFANDDSTPIDKISPSLKVLFDAIDRYYDDLPCFKRTPSLKYLAEQGVLLLNTALTVREGCPGSHQGLWWKFTSEFLSSLSDSKKDTIFVLFGNHAQSFKQYVIKSPTFCFPHPSYCAREHKEMPDFINPVNAMLSQLNKQAIFWK